MDVFNKYGKFCARYSLEVMVCFLTMFVGAVSLNLRSPFEFCKWSFNCEAKEEDPGTHASSDAVLLSILRCATIIYFFVKLRKISKLGSGYLVAGVCMCVAFGSIIFAATLVQLLHKDWTIVGESLPIFLLLIDLSRIVILIQHTLTAGSFCDVQDRIAEAMQKIGPVVTFDTIIEILVIITSSTMKVRQLQDISCFASLSVLLNYIIFTTFVPACLTIFLMITQKQISHTPEWYNAKFSTVLEKEWNREMNPLTYKIKFLLCCTLLAANGARILFGDNFSHNEHMQSSFDSVLTLTPQQFFTVTILMLLFGKIFMQAGKLPNERTPVIELLPHQEIRRESSYVSLIYQEPKKLSAPRSSAICMELLKEDSNLLTDHEIISLVDQGKIQVHRLETTLKDPNRGVYIRRKLLNKKLSTENQQVALTQVPFAHYNFSKATAACCENTVGYIPLPVGVVGPLLLNGEEYHVPMATTEGTLLASTNRGLKAVHKSGGIEATVYGDGMTRAPVVEFPSSREACEMASWLQDRFNFELVKDKFDETSRYARLESLLPIVCGRLLFIRFKATTGDAMGMNMVSKGAEHALRWLRELHQGMKIISLSGNVCTDKKSSSVNWVLGRGKSVVAEARIPESVVQSVLKTDIDSLVHLNTSKNHIGSAMAGSIGGFNAHAANAVTAIYIATGQDPAQNVEGSKCMTILEKIPQTEESEPILLMTCTMPCLEVATCGGGTALDAQRACLNLLGVGGSSQINKPGHNARKLAQIVCATVLASELSLLSALSSGHLVQSHMKHNRLPTQKQKSEHSVLFNL